MSTTYVSVQELSNIYMETYCSIAILALLVYDWLLCLDQEVRFIWNWRSQSVALSSLVYALSRYPVAIQLLLAVTTIYPMSDLSCRATLWTQAAMNILAQIAIGTFSALRVYALSNRNKCLATMIILLPLSPAVMLTVNWLYLDPENLPSPLNCSTSGSPPPTTGVSVFVVGRGSQLVAELLVVCITWWYTHQSYRIQKGVNLGNTISSLLLHNGTICFLCLATLYIVDIILNTSTQIPVDSQEAAPFFDMFIDPIASILTSRFVLSLRQFDSVMAAATYSGMVRERMASTGLEFAGAQTNDSLPAAIVSFAHPIHAADAALYETDSDPVVDNGSQGQEMDASRSSLKF